MPGQTLAVHETMELHELATFKSVCATKSSTMQAIVNDEELKGLMQRDAAQSKDALRTMQDFLQRSPLQCHGDITALMMNRGWYHPYNAGEQIKLDIQRAQTALNLG